MPEWSELIEGLDEEQQREIAAFFARQRWFDHRSGDPSEVRLAEHVTLGDEPLVALCLVECRFANGSSEVYQLVIRVERGESAPSGDVITTVGEQRLVEASRDPVLAALVARASAEGTTRPGQNGEVTFRALEQLDIGDEVKNVGGEQSNTSVVVNDRLIVKQYRHLSAGINPELEMLLFLCEHDFERMPRLYGWYSYAGAEGQATLGVSQAYLPNSIDGWTLGIDEIIHAPASFLAKLGRLGEVVAELHCTLASDESDPEFRPEHPSIDAAAILGARLEDHIEHLSQALPKGRAQQLEDLARSLTSLVPVGRSIRLHGDLHLGQVLWSKEDWMITDFEGEPARSPAERRHKAHPLRDVAGLLRSFSYLIAATRLSGHEVDESFGVTASENFLEAYRSGTAKTALVPEELETQQRLLDIFKLEKMLYELDYELRHRPDWVQVPLAGIDELLTGAA